jgi:hypothetical protein
MIAGRVRSRILRPFLHTVERTQLTRTVLVLPGYAAADPPHSTIWGPSHARNWQCEKGPIFPLSAWSLQKTVLTRLRGMEGEIFSQTTNSLWELT